MKRTRIRPVSKKRAKLNRERRDVVSEMMAIDRTCRGKALFPQIVCSGMMHGHEIKPRGRGGSIVDKSNIVLVCFSHHRYLHDHPDEATRLGLLKHAWEA